MLYYVLGQSGRRQAQDSLFVSLLFSSLSLLILEMLISIFSGRVFTGSRVFLTCIVSMFYLLVPLPGALYFLYIDQLYKHWQIVPHKMGLLILIPSLVNAVFTVISLFNGIIFSIDATNTYQRGKFFFLVFLCSAFYVLGSHVHLVRRRKKSTSKDLSFVISYPFPVVIAAFLQMHLEGVQVLGISLAITLLIKFLHIQDSHANKDYLTSLYNRSLGVQYLQYLFQHKRKGKRIGGILMDINGFKAINDTYGHDMGDKTLRLFANVLKGSFSHNWLICRYGGDEFLVFCELGSRHELEETVLELRKNLGFFNIKGSIPIPLSISIGSAVVEDCETISPEAFIRLLDERMYNEKAEYHTVQPPSMQNVSIHIG